MKTADKVIDTMNKITELFTELIGAIETITANPKPLLADAQVGWICTHRNGKTSTITNTNWNPKYPIYCSFEDEDITVALNGRNNVDSEENEYDIISCEPPAPEGTAEWAWQMMLLGYKVVRKDSKINYPYYVTKSNDIACGFDGDGKTFLSSGHIPLKFENWIAVSDVGESWQIYTEPVKEPIPAPANGFYAVTTVDPIPEILEAYNGKWIYPDGTMREFVSPADILSYLPAEKPQPKFADVKVGDWVEVLAFEKLHQCRVVGKHKNMFTIDVSEFSCNLGRKNDWVNVTYDGTNANSVGFGDVRVNITRKLDPSEVRVKITLEGTVKKCNATNNMGFEVFDSWKNIIAWISYDAIDPATAELVRELIKKQGEK